MTIAFHTLGIVGCGAMGRGIAQIAAQAGSRVLLLDVQSSASQAARDSVRAQWQRMADKGRVDAAELAVWNERLQVAEQLEGQLTATLQIDEADYAAAKPLLRVLERKAGRILVNGFPTGVEVSPAMVHGGPFPASSDARTTSVGSLAIQRFVRPVCYQDMPPALLPDALSDSNPWKLPRLVDGVMG